MRISLVSILTVLFLFSCSPSAKEKRLSATKKENEAMGLYSNSVLLSVMNDDVIREVVSLLDESIAADPQYISPYLKKASMLSKLDNNNEAVEVINTAINKVGEKKEKEITELVTLRAIIYERLGQFDLATRDYEQLVNTFDEILKVNPDDFFALSNRAVVFALSKDVETGITELNKIQVQKLNDTDKVQLKFLKKTLSNSNRDEIIERIDI